MSEPIHLGTSPFLRQSIDIHPAALAGHLQIEGNSKGYPIQMVHRILVQHLKANRGFLWVDSQYDSTVVKGLISAAKAVQRESDLVCLDLESNTQIRFINPLAGTPQSISNELLDLLPPRDRVLYPEIQKSLESIITTINKPYDLHDLIDTLLKTATTQTNFGLERLAQALILLTQFEVFTNKALPPLDFSALVNNQHCYIGLPSQGKQVHSLAIARWLTRRIFNTLSHPREADGLYLIALDDAGGNLPSNSAVVAKDNKVGFIFTGTLPAMNCANRILMDNKGNFWLNGSIRGCMRV